jgi:NAD+ synthase
MSKLNLSLAIDPKREAERIERHIRELVDGNSAGGAAIGLSGGIDSAVLAALAVRAVGKECVCAYYLYDRDSSRQSQSRASLAADWLGIELRGYDITPQMQKIGIYSPLIMKITGLSGFVNRCLNTSLRCLLCCEPFFIYTLRRGRFNGSKLKKFLYDRTVGAVEAAFNARHIYRRQFLEQKSKAKDYLALGAGNRSELMVGWFVKGGIDDLCFSPLIGLYKTQVVQLAEYLDLPGEILAQSPSPDMVKGITDESALGLSYEGLDTILVYIEGGVSDEEILSNGVGERELRLVRTMNRLSAWKRGRENPERYAG